MEWKETISTAISALNARRMRSLLTMLGILIGIAAVMLTVGLGQGASASITSRINALGSNLIVVTPSQSTSSGGFRGGGGSGAGLGRFWGGIFTRRCRVHPTEWVAPGNLSAQLALAAPASSQ